MSSLRTSHPLRLAAPSSKSITQRALVIAALGKGPSVLDRPLFCDDTERMISALRALGTTLLIHDTGEYGAGLLVYPAPLRAPADAIDCGDAGTVARFVCALSLVADGRFVTTGSERLRQRPMGPLVGALRDLGVQVEALGHADSLPLALRRHPSISDTAAIDATASSQFASALLLVGPLLPHGLTVRLAGPVVSRPYLEMTIAMMRAAGADVRWSDADELAVAPGPYRIGRMAIEPDWSAATFLLAAAELTGIAVEVPGLLPPSASLQGDSRFASFLDELRQARPHDLELTDTPDLLAPLAALALFASHPTRLVGIAHARLKECDRVHVLAREFGKLGARVVEHTDGLDLWPLQASLPQPVDLDPEGDHRMAMAFGVLALRLPQIRVLNRDCVRKSYPHFWEAIEVFRASRVTT